MKFTQLFVIAVACAGLAAGGCSARKNPSTAGPELEQQLRDEERAISTLESSVGRLEQDLERERAAAESRDRAAREAERAAREAEGRARAAEAAAAAPPRPAAPAVAATRPSAALLPQDAKPGECYARVFAPPQYRTESVRVLRKEASERIETAPARYEWTEEKVLVEPATTRVEEVVAKFDWVEEKVLVEPAHTMWKKGRGPVERVDNATGEIMCLVEVPEAYKTVKSKKLIAPATTRTIETPAKYTTVKVRKLVQPASEKRIPIPAEYATVERTEMTDEGRMEWRRVLCETNMNRTTVAAIQRALATSGHEPGPIDGVYGRLTRRAVESFQRQNGLPTGGLTLGTLDKLGVRL